MFKNTDKDPTTKLNSIMSLITMGVPMVFTDKESVSYTLIAKLLKTHKIRYSTLVEGARPDNKVIWVSNYDKDKINSLLEEITILDKHMEPLQNITPFVATPGIPYFLRSESGHDWLVFSTDYFKDAITGIMTIKNYLEMTSEDKVLTTCNQIPVVLTTTREVDDAFELMDSTRYLGLGAIYLRGSMVKQLEPYIFNTEIVTEEWLNSLGEKVDNTKTNVLKHIPYTDRQSYEFTHGSKVKLYGEWFEYIEKREK